MRPASVDVVSACWSSSREKLVVRRVPRRRAGMAVETVPRDPCLSCYPLTWPTSGVSSRSSCLTPASRPTRSALFLAPSEQPKPHRGDEARVRVKRHSIVESRLSCPRVVRRRCTSPASGSTPIYSCRCPRCATTEGLAAIRRARDRTSRLHVLRRRVANAPLDGLHVSRHGGVSRWCAPDSCDTQSPGVHSPARSRDGIDRLHGRIVHAPRGAHPGRGTTS